MLSELYIKFVFHLVYVLSEISNFIGAVLDDFLLLVNLPFNLVEELIFYHISEVLEAIVIFTLA